MQKFGLVLFFASLMIACDDSEMNPNTIHSANELYFPPASTGEWEKTNPAALDWNESGLDELYTHLELNNTRAFIVLKDGKIAIEQYWGNTLANGAKFDESSIWYWASAGKTLTATLVGIAQEEGLLDINTKTSDYLGSGWTSLPEEKEALITIKNQLTMTTGLDFGAGDLDCTEPACLSYGMDAGMQWYYHNAPYTLLEEVVSAAAGTNYNAYTDQKIEANIGMNGQWIKLGFNNVYWSTARDMARFGLLILNKGTWEDQPILRDQNYYKEMVSSSQELNPSYGYLWWLNGKNSIRLPGLNISFPIPLSSNAPSDLIAGMGRNGQFVEIVPSQNLVVIRMGEAPDQALVPVQFHDEMWQKLNTVIGP